MRNVAMAVALIGISLPGAAAAQEPGPATQIAEAIVARDPGILSAAIGGAILQPVGNSTDTREVPPPEVIFETGGCTIRQVKEPDPDRGRLCRAGLGGLPWPRQHEGQMLRSRLWLSDPCQPDRLAPLGGRFRA